MSLATFASRVDSFLSCTVRPFLRLESSTSISVGRAYDWMRVTTDVLNSYANLLDPTESSFLQDLRDDLSAVKALTFSTAATMMPDRAFHRDAYIPSLDTLPIMPGVPRVPSSKQSAPFLYATVAPRATIAARLLEEVQADPSARLPEILSARHWSSLEKYAIDAVEARFGGLLQPTAAASSANGAPSAMDEDALFNEAPADDMDVDEDARTDASGGDHTDAAPEDADGESDSDGGDDPDDEDCVPSRSSAGDGADSKAASATPQTRSRARSESQHASASSAGVPLVGRKRRRLYRASSALSAGDDVDDSSNGKAEAALNDVNPSSDGALGNGVVRLLSPAVNRQVQALLNQMILVAMKEVISKHEAEIRGLKGQAQALQLEKTQQLAAANAEIAQLKERLEAQPANGTELESLKRRHRKLRKKHRALKGYLKLVEASDIDASGSDSSEPGSG